jgi:hypothetical protein
MGYYSPGKQASAFKKSFDVAAKDHPHLAWLDETFIHFLFKQEYSRCRTTPPPPQAINSPPQITRVLPTPVCDKGQPSERTFPSIEGSTSGTGSSSAGTSGTGSSSAASSSNNEPHSLASSLGEVAAQVQQTLNMGGRKKGTTDAAAINKIQCLLNARNYAAECLEAKYLSQTNPKSILPHNTLTNIIKKAT